MVVCEKKESIAMEKKHVKKRIKTIFYKLHYIRIRINFFFETCVFKPKLEASGYDKNAIVNDAERLHAQIADTYGDKDAIVTIVSDDGFYDSVVCLNELLRKNDLRATVAGAVKFIKPYLKEWKKIVSEGNIELVSHSFRHVAFNEGEEISRNKERLYYEIAGSTIWFEKKFPELGKQIAFVCPEGAMCKLANEVVKESGFYAVRRTETGYNSLSPSDGVNGGDWFGLQIQGINEKNVDEEVRKQWINEAVDKRLWLIEMWHNVMEQYDGYFQTILKDDADKHLQYISKMNKEGRIWVATLTEATKYIRERQVAEVEAFLKEDRIYVRAFLQENVLPKSVFDFPLTIKIFLPNKMKNMNFYVNGKVLNVSEENELIVNIVPDGKLIEITL